VVEGLVGLFTMVGYGSIALLRVLLIAPDSASGDLKERKNR